MIKFHAWYCFAGYVRFKGNVHVGDKSVKNESSMVANYRQTCNISRRFVDNLRVDHTSALEASTATSPWIWYLASIIGLRQLRNEARMI